MVKNTKNYMHDLQTKLDEEKENLDKIANTLSKNDYLKKVDEVACRLIKVEKENLDKISASLSHIKKSVNPILDLDTLIPSLEKILDNIKKIHEWILKQSN